MSKIALIIGYGSIGEKHARVLSVLNKFTKIYVFSSKKKIPYPKINKLSEKYSATGQDLYSYLDGLLYADYIGYWNYINLETLLSLQRPKTDFPDEKIFIIYHQITELYFKLCLLELEQI